MNKILVTALILTFSVSVHAKTTLSEADRNRITDDFVNWVKNMALEVQRENDKANEQIPVDIQGRVVSIADGDTLTVLDSSNVQHKIRLHAIDAPELGQPFGKAAKAMLSDYCYNKTAKVRKMDIDRYNRVVGDVRCGDRGQHFISVILVKKGMAWVFDKYVPNNYLYLYSLQKEAQDKQLGLWADDNAVPPWEWRNAKK